MESLAGLVEEAYRLFAGYEMGDELGVCTACCVQEEDAVLLKSLSPKVMSRDLIYEYLDAAAMPDDPLLIHQMKYLLPRILELMVQGEELRHSTEITLSKCSCGSAEWLPVEVEFMQRFALAYFAKQFASYGAAAQADDVFVMFHLTGLDVLPLLAYWHDHIASPIVLWGAVCLIERRDRKGFYNNAFADSALKSIIANWLEKADTREVIRVAILDQIEVLKAAGLSIDSCEIVFDWI